MPTVFRWKGYRFFFYSKEVGEPPHIHVLKDGRQLKIWLSDLRVARNVGFAAHEIGDIVAVTSEHRDILLEAWDDHFGN